MNAPAEPSAVPAPGNVGAGRWTRWLIAAAWLALAATGFVLLARYSGTPGGSAPDVARTWPGGTRLDPPTGRPVLLLFLHPECPCSRATVEELAKVVARAPDSYDARALFVPAAASPGSSRLRDAAARIPGLRILDDAAGGEAARFGALTSGTVAVYARDRRRLFFGGITAARAHEGDNAGTGALLALARGAEPAVAQTPVYGCGLAGPARSDAAPHRTEGRDGH